MLFTCNYNTIVITWDEAKRRQNLRDHKIDLARCEPIFDAPMLTEEDTSEAYGEQRLKSYGLLNGRVVLLVWIDRGDTAHVISCREAERYEARKYWKEAPI